MEKKAFTLKNIGTKGKEQELPEQQGDLKISGE